MKKRVAVITGISKGIGREIGNRFAQESIVVIGFSRTSPDGKCSHWVKGDINEKEDRVRLRNEAIEKYGSIDILVNNSGQGLLEKWENTSEKDLRTIFDTNFFSMVEMSQLFIDDLQKTKGSIINVSSALGKMAMPCMGGYCATKFAVEAFSNSLRMELNPKEIHVLNLTVGALKTDFLRNCLGSMTSPPLSGLGCPEVLAKKVYKAYCKRKREVTYPAWYGSYLLFSKLLPSVSDSICRKQWKLGK
jgi:short-subunit dehydrogenase